MFRYFLFASVSRVSTCLGQAYGPFNCIGFRLGLPDDNCIAHCNNVLVPHLVVVQIWN